MAQIETATSDDLPFLREMIWEALMASPTFVQERGIETVQRHEDQYWKEWVSSPDPAFVAKDEGNNQQNLGAIVLYPDRKGYRIGLAVKEEARGRGIGRLLIGRALDFAKESQAHTVGLSVDPGNTSAISLYKSMGFKVTDEKAHELAMEFDLDDAA